MLIKYLFCDFFINASTNKILTNINESYPKAFPFKRICYL